MNQRVSYIFLGNVHSEPMITLPVYVNVYVSQTLFLILHVDQLLFHKLQTDKQVNKWSMYTFMYYSRQYEDHVLTTSLSPGKMSQVPRSHSVCCQGKDN